jgi:hypothetical protein
MHTRKLRLHTHKRKEGERCPARVVGLIIVRSNWCTVKSAERWLEVFVCRAANLLVSDPVNVCKGRSRERI